MARAVVLTFENDQQAERFVANIQRFQKSIEGQEQRWGMPEEGGQVALMVALPTQFCPGSGTGGCSDNRRVRGWVRGKKFGWWVCVVCHKPSDKGGPLKTLRNILSQGVNLLEPDKPQEVASVHDEGFGALGHG